jgi:hypothetical protein
MRGYKDLPANKACINKTIPDKLYAILDMSITETNTYQ